MLMDNAALRSLPNVRSPQYSTVRRGWFPPYDAIGAIDKGEEIFINYGVQFFNPKSANNGNNDKDETDESDEYDDNDGIGEHDENDGNGKYAENDEIDEYDESDENDENDDDGHGYDEHWSKLSWKRRQVTIRGPPWPSSC